MPKQTLRYVENLSGLRFEGYSDKINPFIRHEGWFIDEFQFATYRGAVWRLPNNQGFLIGYRALEGRKDDTGRSGLPHDGIIDPIPFHGDPEDAARLADGIAERDAERDREYNEAWQAGSRYAAMGESLQTLRRNTIRLIREIRDASAVPFPPAICATLRRAVSQAWTEHVRLVRERAELREQFARWQVEAFKEGAGL